MEGEEKGGVERERERERERENHSSIERYLHKCPPCFLPDLTPGHIYIYIYHVCLYLLRGFMSGMRATTKEIFSRHR